MPVNFETIPVSFQLPGTYIEISTAQANNNLVPLKRDILLVGQKIDTAPATEKEVARITSAKEAAELFGAGSELHLMAQSAYENHPLGSYYALPFDNPNNGTANVTSVTLTQVAGSTGEIVITIAGQSIKSLIGGTVAQSATNLSNAINEADVPFTATSALGVVTLTCVHEGVIGNQIPIFAGYYDNLPAGITAEVEQETAGAGSIDIANREAVDNLLGDQWFLSMVIPQHFPILHFVNETEDRNSGVRQKPSQIFQGYVGSFADAETLGQNSNSSLLSITAIGTKSPYSDSVIAAAVAANASLQLEKDPARPLQNIEIKGILAPKAVDQFTDVQRNLLLQGGVGTVRFDNTRKVFFERLRTTYTQDDTGEVSDVLGDVEDVATLIFLRWSLVRFLNLTYPNYKIANDVDPIPPYASITKPSMIKASIVGLAEQWREAGLITDVGEFQSGLVVERAAEEEDRVNLVLSPRLVGQLRQIFGSLQFKL